MSGGLRHPFGGALYVCTPEGNIRVEDGSKEGVFHPDGRWIEGELREADPQLCGWVAGDRHARRGLDVEAD
jgi:hypothetical protein